MKSQARHGEMAFPSEKTHERRNREEKAVDGFERRDVLEHTAIGKETFLEKELRKKKS